MSSDILVKQLRQILETEAAFGVDEIPLPARQGQAGVCAPLQGRTALLKLLEEQYRNCMLCGLWKTRTKLVFGSGNPNARLMFVGEAPGYDEDRQGLPFVGAAGQLLTRIIEAMKLRREDVYIANCLKCRPPNNRSPLPTEIATCNPILARQIEIIQPKVICALGKFAAQTLLGTDQTITRLRGRFFERGGVKIMPTFHPAYLLRNPADKKLVWQDTQKIMEELGI